MFFKNLELYLPPTPTIRLGRVVLESCQKIVINLALSVFSHMDFQWWLNIFIAILYDFEKHSGYYVVLPERP